MHFENKLENGQADAIIISVIYVCVHRNFERHLNKYYSANDFSAVKKHNEINIRVHGKQVKS